MDCTALQSDLSSLCITPRLSLRSPYTSIAPDSDISVQTADRFIPVRSRMQSTSLTSPDHHRDDAQVSLQHLLLSCQQLLTCQCKYKRGVMLSAAQ